MSCCFHSFCGTALDVQDSRSYCSTYKGHVLINWFDQIKTIVGTSRAILSENVCLDRGLATQIAISCFPRHLLSRQGDPGLHIYRGLSFLIQGQEDTWQTRGWECVLYLILSCKQTKLLLQTGGKLWRLLFLD